MPNETQQADHRRLRRKKAKRGTGLTCRRGNLGLGKDLAIAVQDISEDGARLLVKEEISAGTEVEITMVGVGANKRVTTLATVAWCKAEAKSFSIGVRFRDRLPYAEFFNLT